jgi:ribonuclease Z
MANMKVTFLGTSSMIPTKERGQSGIFIDCGVEKILIDCGENTQRQMRIAGIAPPKITRLFITHWHGDHVFGLPGLLENLAKNSFEKKIEVYGTQRVKKKLELLVETFNIKRKIEIKFNIIRKEGVFLETDDYEFGSYFLDHSSPCLGYYVKEKDKVCVDKGKMKKLSLPSGPIIAELKKKKNVNYKGKKIKWKDVTYVKEGKKVSVVMDTCVCKGSVNVAKNSDLFICESTFKGDKAKAAKEYKHLTSVDAGKIAKKSQVKKLVLTHFSQRYEDEDLKIMKKEAKENFKGEVILSKDFMSIMV